MGGLGNLFARDFKPCAKPEAVAPILVLLCLIVDLPEQEVGLRLVGVSLQNFEARGGGPSVRPFARAEACALTPSARPLLPAFAWMERDGATTARWMNSQNRCL